MPGGVAGRCLGDLVDHLHPGDHFCEHRIPPPVGVLAALIGTPVLLVFLWKELRR